jgi:outer membrane protein OmpA-like peptidoglycan-associated protein
MRTMRIRRIDSARNFLAILAVGICMDAETHAEEPRQPAMPLGGRIVVARDSSAFASRAPLELLVDKSKVDLAEHHLELRASRDLAKVTIKVTGESGAILADEARDLSSHPAGTPLVVQWSPSSDEPVIRIEVFAYDMDGFYKGIAITPWAIAIPHEDVNFKTDSAQIEETEKSKLEASFAKVQGSLAKASQALDGHEQLRVTLFVAGHTDTVGDANYNLRLSKQRAQSIARWFRQRGLKIPIAYEGFGEFALLVKTANEVDEPRNRRADYILSTEQPVFKSTGFRPGWNRVP